MENRPATGALADRRRVGRDRRSLVASLAVADNVQNDVTSAGGIETVTAGGAGTTVNYGIQATGMTCDAADGSAVTVTPTGLPTGVSASPGSIAFTTCPNASAGPGITYAAAFSTTPGDYETA